MDAPVEKINVLLVEDDPDFADLVRQWLKAANLSHEFVLNWTDSLSSASSRLMQGDIDVVLLDLNLPDCEGVQTFVALSSVRPNVPIIVLSSEDSESLALSTVRHGADTYFVKSTCTADLLSRALIYTVVRRRQMGSAPGQADESHGRVVGLFGAKGGTGCTTVACSLAGEIHRQTNGSVLLADFDLRAGLVGFLMGLNSRYAVSDIVEHLDRLDRDVWDALVTDIDGIHVVPSSGPDKAPSTETASLARILGFAVGVYDWVVVDLARIETYLALKDQITDPLLITTCDIPSLYQAKRSLGILNAHSLESERGAVIMNRTGGSFVSGGLDLKVFGVHLYGQLPNDESELLQALVQKRLPDESCVPLGGECCRTQTRRP